jgi:hypothetical protein
MCMLRATLLKQQTHDLYGQKHAHKIARKRQARNRPRPPTTKNQDPHISMNTPRHPAEPPVTPANQRCATKISVDPPTNEPMYASVELLERP